MKRVRNVVIIMILLGIIVGGAIFGITRLWRGTPEAPDWLMAESMSLIDDKTLKIVTKTRAEWEKLGRKGSRYKNPETGEYTMAPILMSRPWQVTTAQSVVNVHVFSKATMAVRTFGHWS